MIAHNLNAHTVLHSWMKNGIHQRPSCGSSDRVESWLDWEGNLIQLRHQDVPTTFLVGSYPRNQSAVGWFLSQEPAENAGTSGWFSRCTWDWASAQLVGLKRPALQLLVLPPGPPAVAFSIGPVLPWRWSGWSSSSHDLLMVGHHEPILTIR